jgi:hypothetical protein
VELFRQITAGAYTFRPDIWSDVSPEAKDLIRQMMTVRPPTPPHPTPRPTPSQHSGESGLC